MNPKTAGISLRLRLAIVFLCVFGVPLQADETPLRMVYEEFPPYSFTDTNGQADGLGIDLMTRLARTAGYELTFIPAENPARSLQMLGNGEADVSSLLALTEERLNLGLPTRELGRFELQAFVRRDQSARTIEDLAGLQIGVVAGSFAKIGAAQIPSAQLVEFANTDEMIIPLLVGEIDAVVSASDSFLTRLRAADTEHQIAGIAPPLTSSPYGFIISAARPEVQEALDAAIETSLSPADLRQLRQRWFGRSKTLLDDPAFWWGLGFVVIALIALAHLSYKSMTHKRRAERLFVNNSANTLLLAALDEIAASIVIYDKDLNVVHWNKGTERSFPRLIGTLEKGTSMAELIRTSYLDNSMATELDEDELNAFIDAHIARMRAGEAIPRTVYTTDNRVFEAREYKLGKENYASIRVDVTRLQEQQDVIQDQSHRLEIANGKLSSFAAIAAHDLRSPLTQLYALMGFIDEDLEDAGLNMPEDVRAHWTMMESRIRRMERLIQDLLTFANADVNHQDKSRIMPSEHVRNVVDFIGVKEGFVVQLEPDMPEVIVNETAFETVVRNLISNAIKHHDQPHGTIRISCQTEGDTVTFSVQDDGPGIPEKFEDKIFEPFQRLTNETEGSGLGLSFIRDTVERWGGTVTVVRAHPRGSIFSFTTKLAEPEIQPIRAVG